MLYVFGIAWFYWVVLLPVVHISHTYSTGVYRFYRSILYNILILIPGYLSVHRDFVTFDGVFQVLSN